MSVKNFYENNISFENILFKDLNESDRVKFLTYKIPILTYENATIEETIEMFDNFQNGVALTPGQRFHARLNTNLVKYARERLLTHDRYFYTRASAIWGAHQSYSDTKTKRILMNAMAIVGGAVYGADHITTSYDVLGPILNNEFDVARADYILDKLFKVYERVTLKPGSTLFTPEEQKQHWPVGVLTGYILASLASDSTEENMAKWVDYIASVRNKKNKYADLHANMSASRNWNSARWRIGYENIFVNHVVAGAVAESEDEDSP
jgi:hypothetical protein